MTKYVVETKSPDGSWRPLPYTFDSQSQAEQFIVDEIPEGYPARIVRIDYARKSRPWHESSSR